MSSSSPLQELPAVGFLAETPAEHRAFLASFGKFLRPGNGEIVIAQDSHQDTLKLILDGVLHVVADNANRPVLLASLGAGESIGEVNLFDPAKASATVVSRGESLIWSITRSELDTLVEADPAAGVYLMKGLLRQVSKRIRSMNEKLADSEQRSGFHHFWAAGTP